MDLIGPIQAIALRNALALHREKSELHPDEEYFIRRVCRWYSKTFSTPLHEVQGLPWNDVLLAFFEELYEQRQVEELELIRDELIEDPAEAARKALDNDLADLDAFEIGQEQIEAAKQKGGLSNKLAPIKTEAQKIFDTMRTHDRTAPTLGGSLPIPDELPPDISFSFDAALEDDDSDDRDTLGILNLPKKK